MIRQLKLRGLPLAFIRRDTMKLRTVPIALLSLTVFFGSEPQSNAATPTNSPEPHTSNQAVPGQFVIKFHPETSRQQRQEIVHARGGTIVDRIPLLDVELAEFPALKESANRRSSAEESLVSLRHQPGVKYAEPNHVYRATYTPDDPAHWYPEQQRAWRVMEAYEAWDFNRGPNPLIPPFIQERTVIAIVDTGVYPSHEDLQYSCVRGLVACQFYWPKLHLSIDIVDDDAVPEDEVGHGTAVAGAAVATMDNGKGGAGLCPLCSLMPVRTGRIGGHLVFNVAKGIAYAADNGAHVINLSLGGPEVNEILSDAVNYAWGKGAFVTCGAGNEGSREPQWPAASEHCFAVAATDSGLDTREDYSNYGDWVEVGAPGEGWLPYPMSGPNSSRVGYKWQDGTSIAAPYVAGLAGLLSSQGLTNRQIWDRICMSADRISGTGTDWSCGRINARKAVLGLPSGWDY